MGLQKGILTIEAATTYVILAMRILFLYKGIPICDPIRLAVSGGINGIEYDLESRIHFRSSGHGT